MVAYEFLAKVTKDRVLLIPDDTHLHAGVQVRVILLVEDNAPRHGYIAGEEEQVSSLDQVVAEIKQMPRNSSHVQPDSGLLGKHLVELEQEIDPSFDVDEWLHDWDRVEAEIKQASLDRESRLLQEMSE